ncbi:hypothetical protein [Pseudonocardia sp. WMMC193]|uniref:hypothetical protein n=1 Tax=Pseudonocardia sp. WMMC193 TaxID=2911965 RepID=UPI001F257A9E|nr:hypothetical protein [Pseudonocardia sp. WMMC193]MCF7548519.1 hypothetical protein [Pseudonocardia sp. WMMC193]
MSTPRKEPAQPDIHATLGLVAHLNRGDLVAALAVLEDPDVDAELVAIVLAIALIGGLRATGVDPAEWVLGSQLQHPGWTGEGPA